MKRSRAVVAVEGTGEPIVFLHGLGSRGQAWAPVVRQLKDKYCCIVLDLPGHGAVPMIREPSVDGYCAVILETFSDLQLDRPHVAGNSLGGAIGLELAMRNAVRSTTAISPIGFWSKPEIAFCMASMLLQRQLARLLTPAQRHLTRPRILRSLLFWPMMARPWRMEAQDAWDTLVEFATAQAVPLTLPWTRNYRFRAAPVTHPPLTIAWGKNDLLLPRWQQDRAQLVLPAAACIRLPGCGHVPMSDDPDLVAQVIADTCRRSVAHRQVTEADHAAVSEGE